MGLVRSASPIFAAALAVSLGVSATASAQMLGQPAPAVNGSQQYQSAPVERSPQTPPPPMAPPPLPGWVPSFDSVLTSASTQTAFTFDRTMLQVADGFFSGTDPETRRIVAGLNSVSVRTFHARDFARYDAGALGMIDAQYRAAGWKHLVNANAKDSATATDLWLHFAGPNITNVSVLSRGDRNMTVISVDCTLRPLDMLHLSGHFGIPKVDENAVMVPAH
jgi:hypothetical protein